MQAYPPDMDFLLHHYEVIDSTMNMARSLVASGADGCHIVMADFQTSGKGRIEGRKWIGTPGHSLLMTLVIRGKIGLTALPLKVGLAAFEILANLPRARGIPVSEFPLALKWPNDLVALSHGKARKLGGILCESAGDALLAGIGINLDKDAYPTQMAKASISLAEVGITAPLFDSRTGRAKLALDIADRVVFRLDDEAWQEDYARVLWAVGKQVSFYKGHPSSNDVMRGTVEGIDSAGCILIRDSEGTISAYSSGEISSLG